MVRLRVMLATVALGLTAVMALAPNVALAHARLKSSTPAVGEVLQASPAQVVITFTEDIQKVAGTYDIQVLNGGGQPVTAGPAVIDNTDRAKLSVPLQPDLPAGRYVVNYKNVSDADGDKYHGTFSFYVKVQPTTVDLSNDAQLATVSAENASPAAGTTAEAAGTAAPVATAAVTAPAAGATPAASTGGGSNTGRNIGIGVGIAVIVIVAAGGGWLAFGRRR
ncbi:MAG: copper resistance protein CopC [Chloroflexota bacterium]|nr:copper resistance protein CopC [Chloroflexota bacterium]